MNEFYNTLYRILSPSNLIAFMLGCGITYLYARAQDWSLDMKDPRHAPHITRFKRVYIVLAFCILMIAFIMVRTQVAANNANSALAQAKVVASRAEQIAEENRRCMQEFNNAVKAQALTRSEDINLSDQESRAFAKLFFALLAIDPTLPAEERQAKSRILSQEYAETLRATQAQRIANEEYRKTHPYPEPTCGR